MLSNGETGMFDKLIQDDKVNDIQIDFQSLEDCGFIMIHYLNNMYSNRKKSEKMIYEILDAFKSGNFSDDLFEAVKMDFVVSNMLMNEDINNIISNLINLEIRGMTYEEYLSEIESVRNLSKEDLIKVVNKYFNDKHYVIRTKKWLIFTYGAKCLINVYIYYIFNFKHFTIKFFKFTSRHNDIFISNFSITD